MNRNRLLKHLVFLMFFIFISNLLAQKFYWYFSIWYFDIIMHFFGGFWVGLFFIYVFSQKNKFFHPVIKIVVGVLFVGILWEFFEFFTNNYIGRDPFNILDTISDLFFDLFGGLCAILYLWKKQLK